MSKKNVNADYNILSNDYIIKEIEKEQIIVLASLYCNSCGSSNVQTGSVTWYDKILSTGNHSQPYTHNDEFHETQTESFMKCNSCGSTKWHGPVNFTYIKCRL